MTKKHFIAIAKIMDNYSVPQPAHIDAQAMRKAIAGALADTFARDNARFDRARFLAACSVEA